MTIGNLQTPTCGNGTLLLTGAATIPISVCQATAWHHALWVNSVTTSLEQNMRWRHWSVSTHLQATARLRLLRKMIVCVLRGVRAASYSRGETNPKKTATA